MNLCAYNMCCNVKFWIFQMVLCLHDLGCLASLDALLCIDVLLRLKFEIYAWHTYPPLVDALNVDVHLW